ncbi:hypothetical protein BH24ACT26_BH24ACT26_23390 [soil metagenome]
MISLTCTSPPADLVQYVCAMPMRWHPSPDQFRGRGTVWLYFDDFHDVYRGYWDLEPDGPPTALEECPVSTSQDDAIEWGRARSPVVLLRPASDVGAYHWAGAEEPPSAYGDFPRLPLS